MVQSGGPTAGAGIPDGDLVAPEADSAPQTGSDQTSGPADAAEPGAGAGAGSGADGATDVDDSGTTPESVAAQDAGVGDAGLDGGD